MSKRKNQKGKLSHLEEAIKQSEKYYEELAREHKETLEKLEESKEGEVVERLLKNEAYAFLLAEGLIDKFLEFRESFHRTKAQDALYNLVAEADMGGLWIDL
jgi:predicted transcriptional regulator